MITHQINCKDPWFSHLRNGTKTVEGRKNTHTYKRIRVGDRINFINGAESFLAEVTDIREYPSIEQYFEDVTLENALPGVKTLEEGLATYYAWTPKEKIEQYGFLGIFIKPL